MSSEIINTRKEVYDLSLEEKFNEFYNYSEPTSYILNLVFNGPKLTSINNFFQWWKWLTVTIKSFQCDINYINLVKHGNKEKKHKFFNSKEILIKSLLLNSIVNGKDGRNFWKSKKTSELTSTDIIISVLKNYSFILPHEEIHKLNSKFTLDKNVGLNAKCKEWRRLKFINDINDCQCNIVGILSNFKNYVIEHNLDYEGIEDNGVPIVVLIKNFYRQLKKSRELTNPVTSKSTDDKKIELYNKLGNASCVFANGNSNHNNDNVVFKNGNLSFKGSKKIKKRFGLNRKKIKVNKNGNNNGDQKIDINENNKSNQNIKPEPESRSICHDCGGRHKTKFCSNLSICPKCNIRHHSQMPVCPPMKVNNKFKNKRKRKGKKDS